MRSTPGKLPLLATLLIVLGGGCVVDPESPGEGLDPDLDRADGWGPSRSVPFVDAEPRPGETLTEARARALTDYGQALVEAWDDSLAQSFARRGAVGEPLGGTYGFRVEGGSCFSEDPRLGSDYDIVSDADVRAMTRQVEYAVEFLARFHEDANGYPNRFFDRVALCPDGQIGGRLALQGRVLYVGVSYWFGRITTRDAFAVRSAWTGGEHLEASYPTLSAIWFLLDPVGTPRLVLRDAVAAAASHIGDRLAGALEQPERGLRADLLDLVRRHTIEGYRPDEGEPMRDLAVEEVEAMDEARLRELAELWQGFVTDPEHWEGMTEAVLATHQATARNAYDVDLEQWGVVVVGNFHDVTVDISAFMPRNRDFVRYVQIEQVPQSVRVRQYGLVAVYTMDDVEVGLAVTADRGVETAGLEHALARVAR